jgi:putative ABC transport system permease protein
MVVSTGLTRDRSDLQVGSEWTLEVNGRESTWTIVGVMLAQDQRAYAQSSVLSRAARLSGQATRAVFRVEQANDPAAHKAVARALEEQYDRAGLPVSVSQVIDELLQANLNQGNLITVLLMVMAALLAVVGGLGLGATMGLNVLDRTREIGVLRAIGASNGSMWGIILAEGLVIGLLSWILGTLLAVPIGRLLSGGVGLAFFGMWIEYAFSYWGIALWLIVAALVSALASLLPARRASRISVREALAYE